MQPFKFYMPTQIIFGEGCIRDNAKAMILGSNALIVTGKSSAKNGALDDVVYVLDAAGVKYLVYDETEENPALETADKVRNQFCSDSIDFIVAIGGGSPLDLAKAIGVLLHNPSLPAAALYESAEYRSCPIAAVPTTAGTGSEVTPYAVLTLHEQRTKTSMKPLIFPAVAFLDPRYTEHMPDEVTANTAIDALCHLIEGYLSTRGSFFGDQIAEKGLEIFGSCRRDLQSGDYSGDIRAKLLIMSAIAGMLISQTGTSMPHMMGYALTYFKNIPHGRATAMTLTAYMRYYAAQKGGEQKVGTILRLTGFKVIDELDKYLNEVLCIKEKFTEEDVMLYTDVCKEKQSKWIVDPFGLTCEDVVDIYRQSLDIVEKIEGKA